MHRHTAGTVLQAFPEMSSTNSTTRFSNRVADYVRYRPGYPAGIIPYLQDAHGLRPGQLVADIGAGTGISTALFLDAGYRVIAVEPNAPMRDKATELLGHTPGFAAQDGAAEATGLSAESVDAIIAGQAFHWFDALKSRAEFRRILKGNGPVVLIWNERKTASAFEKAYDAFITRHARDYVQVDHRNIDAAHIEAFFKPQEVDLKVFPNEQVFDFEGLKGRLLSSSYMPAAGEEGYEAMLAGLQLLYTQHEAGGKIVIAYDTKVYAGRL